MVEHGFPRRESDGPVRTPLERLHRGRRWRRVFLVLGPVCFVVALVSLVSNLQAASVDGGQVFSNCLQLIGMGGLTSLNLRQERQYRRLLREPGAGWPVR